MENITFAIKTTLDWIVGNKEWLFSGILTSTFFFFLGRKSVQWEITLNNNSQKNIQVNGSSNRTAGTYHEDNSTHINKTIIIRNNHRIDYSTYETLTLCASGCEYHAPAKGAFYIKGLTGAVCVNNEIEEAILPEGKQICVEKNDLIRISYVKRMNNVEFKFYYCKDSSND